MPLIDYRDRLRRLRRAKYSTKISPAAIQRIAAKVVLFIF